MKVYGDCIIDKISLIITENSPHECSGHKLKERAYSVRDNKWIEIIHHFSIIKRYNMLPISLRYSWIVDESRTFKDCIEHSIQSTNNININRLFDIDSNIETIKSLNNSFIRVWPLNNQDIIYCIHQIEYYKSRFNYSGTSDLDISFLQMCLYS